jgi:hypothetical protein
MKTPVSLICLLLACVAARAEDPKPGAKARAAKTAPVVDTKQATGKTDTAAEKAYEFKHKSVFTASAKAHNPFWPIGWVKVEGGTSLADNAPAPMVPRAEDFMVTSILLNEPPIAVINGKEMAEGEVAPMIVNGQPVMMQLMSVQDGRVILRWQNQKLVVPLHRDENISQVVQEQAGLTPR